MDNMVTNDTAFTPDNLFVGNDLPVLTKGVTLASGTAFKRGDVIALNASRKGVLATKESVDDVIGVLTDDVDAISADVISTIYISGHFNSGALRFASGTAFEDVEIQLRKLGIFGDAIMEG